MVREEIQGKVPKRVLITGGAGFIGSHLADRLLEHDCEVVIIDNFHDYYSPAIKRQNIEPHLKKSNYTFIEGDIRDPDVFNRAFSLGDIDAVVHLAALAGVRPSLEKPSEYMNVNICGLQNLLDATKRSPDTRVVFASSSSVYGNRSSDLPFREIDRVSTPYSAYAASKASGELLCHAAHECFGTDIVCLRFFTVYGPRQRPDLAINKFCHLIDAGKPIEVYGDGSTKRDYTFVADTVSGIVASLTAPLSGYEIINLGRGEPVMLNDMIDCIEKSLGKRAERLRLPEQTGDVAFTFANIDKAKRLLNYSPKTDISEGIDSFVRWYKEQTAKVR